MKKKSLFFTGICFFITLLTSVCLASVKEYAFSELNVALKINDNLYTVTRATTSADPALSILDTSVEQLKIMLEANNIYLEAFPEDLSYEIVLSGGSADNAKSYNDMTDEEIIALAKEKENIQASENASRNEENGISDSADNTRNADYSVKTVNNVKYLVSEISSQKSGDFYYIYRYSTVCSGTATSLTLQSGEKPDDAAFANFNEALTSMEHKDIASSLSENPYFADLMGNLLRLVIAIGLLLLILFLFIRVDRKNHSH